jgi:hypothetical protein
MRHITDQAVPVSQVGFWKNRSSTEQVMALTSHIEAGFERKLKTGTIFIDLIAAYDTVWRDRLMLKFMCVPKYPEFSTTCCRTVTFKYFLATPQ